MKIYYSKLQDEGHTKDEFASIGPYTHYSTLRCFIPIHFVYNFINIQACKQCNKIGTSLIEQNSMDYNYVQLYY